MRISLRASVLITPAGNLWAAEEISTIANTHTHTPEGKSVRGGGAGRAPLQATRRRCNEKKSREPLWRPACCSDSGEDPSCAGSGGATRRRNSRCDDKESQRGASSRRRPPPPPAPSAVKASSLWNNSCRCLGARGTTGYLPCRGGTGCRWQSGASFPTILKC